MLSFRTIFWALALMLLSAGRTMAADDASAAWVDQVRRQLSSSLIYPRTTTQPSSQPREAVAKIMMERSGPVRKVNIVRPSGDTAIDAASLRGIRRAGSRPALPQSDPEPTVTVRLPWKVVP